MECNVCGRTFTRIDNYVDITKRNITLQLLANVVKCLSIKTMPTTTRRIVNNNNRLLVGVASRCEDLFKSLMFFIWLTACFIIASRNDKNFWYMTINTDGDLKRLLMEMRRDETRRALSRSMLGSDRWYLTRGVRLIGISMYLRIIYCLRVHLRFRQTKTWRLVSGSG